MKVQKYYSMAIQALNEYKDSLVSNNGGLIDAGQFACAIQECDEAITYFEGMKTICNFVAGFNDCNFTIYPQTPCSDEDGSEKE